MNPQLENGYTRIANEIIENVYKMKLSGGKLRIILVVWRYTYGFNRKSTDLSISFISKATGIHKQQVKTELKELISMGVLIVTKVATFSTSRELAFNKHFSYEEAKMITGSENNPPTGSENNPPTGSENNPPTGSESTTQDKEPIYNTKDTIETCHEEALKINKELKEKELVKKVLLHYENQTGKTVSSIIVESLLKWCDEIGHDLVMKSIEIAVKAGKPNYNYMAGIMKNFVSEGIKTVEDLEKQVPPKKPATNNKFINHEQHTYNFDEIEAKNEALLDGKYGG